MQVNKFVVIGAISLVSVGAISFVNNAMFQEEQRMARLKLKSAEVGCSTYLYSVADVKSWEERVKENPNNEKYKEYLKQARESAANDKKACEKIEEYKNKYER